MVRFNKRKNEHNYGVYRNTKKVGVIVQMLDTGLWRLWKPIPDTGIKFSESDEDLIQAKIDELNSHLNLSDIED